MNRAKKEISVQKARLLFVCFCIVVFLLSAFFTVAAMLDFDTADGLFVYGSVLGAIASMLLFVFALFAGVWLFLPLRAEKKCADKHPVMLVASGAVCFSMLLLVIETVMRYRGLSTIEKLTLLFAVLSVLYFVLSAVRCLSRLLPLFAFAPVGFAATYLLSIYFEMTQPLNGEMRILEQMALLAALLFMLCDVRLLLDRCSARLGLALGILCMTLAAPYGVATVAMACAPTHGVPLPRLLVACFLLSYAVYAGLKVWFSYLQRGVDKRDE